jgi:hypothetical protein
VLGLVPASVIASRSAHRVEGPVLRRSFGLRLVVLGVADTIYRLAAG